MYIYLSICVCVCVCIDFPGGTGGKEPICQCRRHKSHGFDPWVSEIPWRKAWKPTPLFLPRQFPCTKEAGGLQFTGLHRVGHH